MLKHRDKDLKPFFTTTTIKYEYQKKINVKKSKNLKLRNATNDEPKKLKSIKKKVKSTELKSPKSPKKKINHQHTK